MPTAPAGPPETPIGLVELVAATAGATRTLDAGCGSGRLTVALAQAGSAVTGIDIGRSALEQASARAEAASVELELVLADFEDPLPFDDTAFDAVTSRLSLMVARDPVAVLRELGRVLRPEGRIATAIWAPIGDNAWFGAPREAVASALGDERALFARAFGRYGDPDVIADMHRAAGFRDVAATLISRPVRAPDAATHWQRLVRENGHFRSVSGVLGDEERASLSHELADRLARYRDGDELVLSRTLVLVTGHR